MRKIIPYNPKLKHLARLLRKRSTPAEIMLWRYLKGKRMRGYDFHRQKPLGDYIVDFYCHELSLAVELDGRSHWENVEADIARQRSLERKGVRFLRFSEYAVRHRISAVLQTIADWIDENGGD